MKNEFEIFKNDDYKFISNFVESKISLLKENADFNDLSLKLIDSMQELDSSLSDNQKKLFDDVINLFYANEEYYFAFAYMLGVRFGSDLDRI